MATTTTPAALTATYSRERHAAHTGPGTGWDLEKWDVVAPTLPASPPVPADAEYHSGYVDRAGVQHWIYVRRAPLSEGTCVWCQPKAETPAAGGARAPHLGDGFCQRCWGYCEGRVERCRPVPMG